VVAGRRVYVSTGDDGIYCLDVEADGRGQARVHWHRPAADYPDAETALAVHEGRLYLGLGFNGRALCVLDAATGEELKRVELPYPAFGPPLIVDDKLYLGMGDGTYTQVGHHGAVACIDSRTLAMDWLDRGVGPVIGSVVCAGGELYCASQDGSVYCFDKQGQRVSSWNTYAAIHASPVLADKHVYVVNSDGVLFALSRTTLEPQYEHLLGPPGLYVSSPVVAHGRIYVGSEFGFHAVPLPPATGDTWVARSAE
jgi:outer membrane protein assembly factor BamB